MEFASNGGRGSGYLSTPPSARGPGVIVVQEWWGLVPHIRDVADRFAAEGYVALAPDLFHGRTTREPDEAAKLLMALDVDQAAKDLRGAIEYLLGEGGATGSKVAVIGFCMGGALAVYAGTIAPDKVGAIADFYGGHPKVQPDLAKLQAPVLGIFAGKDGFLNAEFVRNFERQLTSLGKQHEIHVYPEADHAFFNDHRPEVYRPDDAADAWRRTLAFFKRHVG